MGALGAPLVAAVIAPDLHHNPRTHFYPRRIQMAPLRGRLKNQGIPNEENIWNSLSRRSWMSHGGPPLLHYPGVLSASERRLPFIR